MILARVVAWIEAVFGDAPDATASIRAAAAANARTSRPPAERRPRPGALLTFSGLPASDPRHDPTEHPRRRRFAPVRPVTL